MANKKIYAVRKGSKTGLFSSWDEAKIQVLKYQGAQYKSFFDREEAEIYLKNGTSNPKQATSPVITKKQFQNDHVEKYGSLLTPFIKQTSTSLDNYKKAYPTYHCPVNKVNFALLGKSVLYDIQQSPFNWNSSPAYVFVDCLDNHSFIFNTYKLLTDHQEYRKKCVKPNDKSATFFRKLPSLQYAYNYLVNKLYDLEEKYMNKNKIEKLNYAGFSKSTENTIHVYCDGSSKGSAMGRGIYYDLESLNDKERNIVSQLLKENGSRPDNFTNDSKNSNNIAELSACQRVFEDLLLMYKILNKNSLKKIYNVVIHTDSSYSLFAIEKHMANLDLKQNEALVNQCFIEASVKPYLQLKTFYRINDAEDMFKMEWVAGHSNSDGNNRADRLAFNAMKGNFVNNEINESLDFSANDSNKSPEIIEIVTSDSESFSDGDSSSDSLTPVPLEEDTVFNMRLCELLQLYYRAKYEPHPLIIRDLEDTKALLEKVFNTKIKFNQLRSRFPWIVWKARLNCNIPKFDELRTPLILERAIQRNQMKVYAAERWIRLLKDRLIIYEHDERYDPSDDNEKIGSMKITLKAKWKVADVLNEYVTENQIEIPSFTPEYITSITSDSSEDEEPLLKRQKL